MRRDRGVVENHEFDAFARRIVRAYARRVAEGDIEALPALRDLSATVDTALQDAVTGLRGFGYSWAERSQHGWVSPGRPFRCAGVSGSVDAQR